MRKAIEDLPIFILGEEITTCPKCGRRTDFEEINDMEQIHTCLNDKCQFIFKGEYDEEFTEMGLTTSL
jgi:hypothetical protein